ncbi:cytochrome c oxidase assembly protein COX20, mitochondrial [Hippopotamus amphibius kiboko]|uniref:cytochrome c oxidase assembly protein COX20, mitochondrial n=1 Tax=Hippopotamus amphibius kiboko TaxID=575201 RepID=UPI00259A9394|nr:cytochrome c oxidase assembly protein COX20, mitochondrial [Hippopotamus amphibius kiboko]
MADGADAGAGQAGRGGASAHGSPRRQGGTEPFKLLGILDVENIPCARDSILYGSLGSVVAGLGHFLLTSRIRRSCDIGVGGFILVTLGCWFHCRYNYAKLRIQERLTREGIKNKILYESTHLDPERKQTNGDSSSN